MQWTTRIFDGIWGWKKELGHHFSETVSALLGLEIPKVANPRFTCFLDKLVTAFEIIFLNYVLKLRGKSCRPTIQFCECDSEKSQFFTSFTFDFSFRTRLVYSILRAEPIIFGIYESFRQCTFAFVTSATLQRCVQFFPVEFLISLIICTLAQGFSVAREPWRDIRFWITTSSLM